MHQKVRTSFIPCGIEGDTTDNPASIRFFSHVDAISSCGLQLPPHLPAANICCHTRSLDLSICISCSSQQGKQLWRALLVCGGGGEAGLAPAERCLEHQPRRPRCLPAARWQRLDPGDRQLWCVTCSTTSQCCGHVTSSGYVKDLWEKDYQLCSCVPFEEHRLCSYVPF